MSFDEACDMPWVRLKEAYPDAPIEHGCLSVTLEYRGQADVSDELAAFDADALMRFLRLRGVLAGDPGDLPEPLCNGTPFKQSITSSSGTGILSTRLVSVTA